MLSAMNGAPSETTPTVGASGPAPITKIVARFPSRQDVFYVLGACVIPIFLWALLLFLFQLKGFALRLNLWDLVGMASYTLATALIESIILLLPVLVLAVILPARFLKNHFVAFGSTIVLISSLWMMYANRVTINFSEWGASQWVIGLGLYVGSIALAFLFLTRSERARQTVERIVKRGSVLAAVYIAIGCLGVLIVVMRNL